MTYRSDAKSHGMTPGKMRRHSVDHVSPAGGEKFCASRAEDEVKWTVEHSNESDAEALGEAHVLLNEAVQAFVDPIRVGAANLDVVVPLARLVVKGISSELYHQ